MTISSSVDFQVFFQHCLREMQSVLWSETETGNLPQVSYVLHTEMYTNLMNHYLRLIFNHREMGQITVLILVICIK